MTNIIKSYVQEYFALNNKCKLYLFLYMLFSISSGVFFFIAIYLKLHLNLDVTTIGNICACFVLGQLLGSWLASNVVDKFNYFYITSSSLFVLSLSLLSICFIESELLLKSILLVMGIASYFHIISSNFLITHLAGQSPQSRARAISLLEVSSNIGLAIGGVLVSYFSTRYSKMMFIIISMLLIFAAIIYLLDGKVQFHSNADTPEINNKPNKVAYKLSLFFIFMFGLIFAQQRVSYALFLNSSFGKSGASSLFLLNSLIIIFCLPNLTQLVLKYNKILAIGIGAILLGLGMCMLQFVSFFLAAILICAVITLGEMLGTTLSQLLCFESTEKNNRGKALSYYKFLYALGTVIGTSLGGYLQEELGIRYVWVFCGFIGVLLFLISLHFTKNPTAKEVFFT